MDETEKKTERNATRLEEAKILKYETVYFPKPSSFSNLTKVEFMEDEDPFGKEYFLIEFVTKYKHAPSLYEMDDLGYPIGQIWYNIKRFRHSVYMSKLCKLSILRDDYETYQRTHGKKKNF